MRKAILSLVAMLCVVWLGYGYAYRDGMAMASLRKSYQAHMDAGRYVKAYNAAAYLAHKGDMDAYFNLGKMYENGQGVVPNIPRAIAYFKLAGLAGNPSAQVHLGEIYMHGGILPKDKQRAAHWFEKAIFNGRGDARIPLNTLFRPTPVIIAENYPSETPRKETRKSIGLR